MPAVCRLQRISWDRGRSILDGIDWTIEDGQHWVLMGPNGCGKSTLLKILSLQEWPSVGRVELLGHQFPGEPVFPTRQRIGLFETRDAQSLIENYPGIRVVDSLLFGLTGRLPYYANNTAEEERMARRFLSTHLGREISPDSLMQPLSSGERSRVLLLQCMISRPDLLLLDEPFDNLDIAGTASLQRLLAELRPSLRSSVMVLHRIEEIPPYVSHAAVLSGGRFLQSGPCEEVLRSDVLSDAYGIPLEVEMADVPHRKYRWKVL